MPVEFLDHGSRSEVMDRVGLTSRKVAQDIVEQVLGTKVPVARPLPGEVPSATGQFPKL